MGSDSYRAEGEAARRAAGDDGKLPAQGLRIRANLERLPVGVLWALLGRGPLGRITPARLVRWRDQAYGGAFLGAWYGAAAEQELRAYLGDEFDESLWIRHRHAVDEEEEAAPDDITFYRTSSTYLYDLTRFAAWGTKEPYLAHVRRIVRAGSRLLDFGCGIGNDGLRFLDDGYRVDFADFANPSTEYLRWRLERRPAASTSQVFDVEGAIPDGYDLVFSFDVIEHVDDPDAFLDRLESLGRLVAVNFLEPDPADTHLHRPLPIPRLMARAAKQGIAYYHCYEGRSHFVVYGTRRAGATVRNLTTGLTLLGLDRAAARIRRADR